MDILNEIKRIKEMKSLEDPDLYADLLENIRDRLSILKCFIEEELFELGKLKPSKPAVKNKVKKGQKLKLKKVKKLERAKDVDLKKMQENYKLIYPPNSLTNKELNADILDAGLKDYEFLFLRTLTHPYRHSITKKHFQIVSYIYNLRDLTIEEINYLTSGTNHPEFREKDFQSESDKEDSDDFPLLSSLKSTLEQDQYGKVQIKLNKKELSFKITKGENWISPNLPKQRLLEMLDHYGFLFTPIIKESNLV